MVQFEPILVKTYNTHSNNNFKARRTVCYVHLWVFVSADASDGDVQCVVEHGRCGVLYITHLFLCECASMPSA